MALLRPFYTIRSSNKVLPHEFRQLICQVARIPFEEIQNTGEQDSAAKGARCDICSQKKGRKTTLCCAILKDIVYQEHVVTVCSSCI